MLLVETRGLEEGLVGVAITGGVDPVQVTFTDPGNPVLADLGFISVGIIAPDVARNGQAGPGLVYRRADLSCQGIDLLGSPLPPLWPDRVCSRRGRGCTRGLLPAFGIQRLGRAAGDLGQVHVVLLQELRPAAVSIADVVGAATIIQAQAVHVIFADQFGYERGLVTPRIGIPGVNIAASGAVIEVRPRGIALQHRVWPALASFSGDTNLRINLQALRMSALDHSLHVAAIRDQLLGSDAAIPIDSRALAVGNDEVNASGFDLRHRLAKLLRRLRFLIKAAIHANPAGAFTCVNYGSNPQQREDCRGEENTGFAHNHDVTLSLFRAHGSENLGAFLRAAEIPDRSEE